MAVGLYVTSHDELTACLPTAYRIAGAYRLAIQVLVRDQDTESKKQSLLVKNIRARISEFNENSPGELRIKLKETDGGEEQFLEAAKNLGLLLIPYVPDDRGRTRAVLADKAACPTLRLLADETNPTFWQRIYIVDDDKSGTCRRLANRLDDLVPGCQIFAIHPGSPIPEYRHDDLVLIGTNAKEPQIARDKAEEIRTVESAPTVGIVLAEHSTERRMYAQVENAVQSFVPQMKREERRELTADLEFFCLPARAGDPEKQRASRNARFDFLAMMGASATLASIGLVQDSAAVVIGAMLVAPLMTPILTGALALVHTNERLYWRALKTIAIGFLFALCASIFVGLMTRLVLPHAHVTDEMWKRCRPSLLDFLVGFAGGGAAAYARTRGQLSSALAGAAIAAALVPPIATAGLQIVLPIEGDGQHGLPIWGPLLLFGMNVLSIMLAASLSLWAVGVRSHNNPTRSSRRWQWGLIGVLIVLACACLAGAQYWVPEESGSEQQQNESVE